MSTFGAIVLMALVLFIGGYFIVGLVIAALWFQDNKAAIGIVLVGATTLVLEWYIFISNFSIRVVQ